MCGIKLQSFRLRAKKDTDDNDGEQGKQVEKTFLFRIMQNTLEGFYRHRPMTRAITLMDDERFPSISFTSVNAL